MAEDGRGRAAAMDDVWFGLGQTRREFDTYLRALALKGDAPLVAVAGGEAPAVVLASRTLFPVFGATSDTELSDRLLHGNDPGARRLLALCTSLPLGGAPRLERLRFYVGPGSEIITFLCRRVALDDGRAIFVAAALGLRPGLMQGSGPAAAAPEPASTAILPVTSVALPEPRPAPPLPAKPMNVQAIQAALRTRWPASRTVRFLWQTDADAVCTSVTPPLSEVVGIANGDLVGCNLIELAPQIDPSGKLGAALASHATWSGLDVAWPIADAPAAVAVALGAIPAIDRDLGFSGYRGYGVIHLDRIVTRDQVRFVAPAASEALVSEAAKSEVAVASDNVVRFPGGAKTLSAEDQRAFDELGVELRDQSGLGDEDLSPAHVPEPPAPEPVAALSEPIADTRAGHVGRNALPILDRLATGLLVTRSNVPIFANRHLLDLLGFADEDALHEAGGMAHLFGGVPGNATGSEAVGLRAKDGRIVPVNARMQCIEWDGLPATLLTLQPQFEARPADPAPADPAPVSVEPVSAVLPVADASLPEAKPAAERAEDSDEARELRAILETATDGVAVIDADCNVVSLNRSGEALFGCDRGAVIGKPFLSLFAEDNQSLAADYLDGLKSNATKSLFNDGREILINAHQGGTIPVFMTLGRLDTAGPTQDGATPAGPRFCALFRDLTHWKKVEQDLEAAKASAERSSALKSDFLAKVSHEVRTPLNAIIGFAEVIMEERFGPVGNERYRDYLRDIHASGTHVMSLVNDLLDLSKIEAGKMELAEDVLDVNKVVNETVSLMQPQASRERVILRLSLAQRLPQIKADERSLRQIVLNLLSNAVKFNEPGGQVIVATTATETGQVVIRIRDTGHGMSDADISAALEPFRQLSTKASSTNGTGLGLPLTKALVEANQASFTIKSKRDQGTLVEVAFPPARVLAG